MAHRTEAVVDILRRVDDLVRPKYGHMALKRATEENLSIIVQDVVDRVVIVDIKVKRGRPKCCCCGLFGCWEK